MISKKKVFANSIIFTINSIMLKAFNFLLIPLYTSYLTPNDYGVINLSTSYTAVMSFVISFSLYSAAIRFYTDCQDDVKKVKSLYSTYINFLLLSGIFFAVLSFLAKPVLLKYIFKDMSFYPTVLLTIITTSFSTIYLMYEKFLISKSKAVKFSVLSIIYLLMQIFLNIFFVVKCSLGANGVLIASVIVNVIFTVYVIFDLSKQKLYCLKIDFKTLKTSLKYSIPLMPHDLSTSIATLCSRVFLNNSYSLASVGLYSLAAQFVRVVDTVQASVSTSITPWFFDCLKINDKSSKKSILEITNYIMWIYGFIFIGFGLFTQEAVLIFANHRYIMAWTVVPLMLVTHIIKTMYYFHINILLYDKKASKYVFLATLSGSILNIIFSALLIPKFDMYGSAVGDIISIVVRVIIITYLSYKFNDIGYKLWDFIKYILIFIIFIAVGLIFSYTKYVSVFNIYNFIYKVAIFLLYTLIAFFALRKNLEKMLILFKRKKHQA